MLVIIFAACNCLPRCL